MTNEGVEISGDGVSQKHMGLEKQHQPESDGQPDAHQLQPAPADGVGACQQQSEHGGDTPDPAEGRKVDPDPLQQHLLPTGHGIHPFQLPETEGDSAEREREKRERAEDGEGPKRAETLF